MNEKPTWNEPNARAGSGKKFGFVALRAIPGLIDRNGCMDVIFRFLRPGRKGEICPFCGAELSVRMQATFRRFGKCHCIGCRRQFTATTGTPLNSAKLSPSEILMTAALIELGAPPEAISLATGRSLETARSWQGKLKDMRHDDDDAVEPLGPPVGERFDDQAGELLPLDVDLESLRLEVSTPEGLHLDRLDHERDHEP